MAWDKTQPVSESKYTCGHCGLIVSSVRGYNNYGKDAKGSSYKIAHIAICPSCNLPTHFKGKSQLPHPKVGESVTNIDDPSVANLYNEARSCTEVGAFTAAVLCCRKLLMNIAVSKGAEQGKSFAHYVTHLDDNRYFPPDAHEWVDRIRTIGNQANHEIKEVPKEDAVELLTFVEMLLRFIFEYPNKLNSRTTNSPP